jgi:hypothetical protein
MIAKHAHTSRYLLLAPLLLSLLPLLSVCDSGDPTAIIGPDDDIEYSGGIQGVVLNITGGVARPFEGAAVTVRGDDADTTIVTGDDGVFSVSKIPPGEYTVLPEYDQFVISPEDGIIDIADSMVVMNFYAMDLTEVYRHEAQGSGYVCGRAVTSDGEPVNGVRITFDNGTERIADTGPDGYYACQMLSHGTYTVSARKEPLDVPFSPDGTEIEITGLVTLHDFTAHESLPPFYTISGRFLDKDGNGVASSRITVKNDKTNLTAYSDSEGRFLQRDILSGDYYIHARNIRYVFPDYDKDINISGDIVLPDMIGEYIGPTNYTFNGGVVDPDGFGIPDVRLSAVLIPYSVESDEHGQYDSTWYGGPISVWNSIGISSFVIRPERQGFVFIPAERVVEIPWVRETFNRTITIPPFIGQRVSASDYFPLGENARWEFARLMDGIPSGESEIAVTGAGGNGGWTVPSLFSTYSASYVLDDSRVLGTDPTTGALIDFLRFGVETGASWRMTTESGAYPVMVTALAPETVTVPAGIFLDCSGFEIRVIYGESTFEATTLRFAKSVGPVLREYRVVANSILRDTVTDELRSYSLP